jgi:hypothetical protein
MSEIEAKNANWVQTPLSRFGFKCIMNKHNFCDDSSCECLCHSANYSKVNFFEKELKLE